MKNKSFSAPKFIGSSLIKTMFLCIISLFAACANFNMLSPSLLELEDEKFMGLLAQLAKEGARSICSPREVENKLGLIILPPKKTENSISDGSAVVSEHSIIHAANREAGTELKTGIYRRFRSESESHCGISIELFSKKICGVETGKFNITMGRNFTYLGASPHKNIFPIVYSYPIENGRSTQIFVGNSSADCTNIFSITTEGEWQ